MPGSADPCTLGALLERAAQRYGAQRALTFPPEQLADATLSFRQLNERVRASCDALGSMGLRHGDHLGVLLHNGPDAISLWLAAAILGVVLVPINSRYRSREIAYVVKQAQLRFLLTAPALPDEPDLLARALDALPEAAITSCPLEHLRALALPSPPHSADARSAPTLDSFDTALLMYTSGTTANPKGCLITHDTVVRAGKAMASEGCYDLGIDDRIWNPLPMFHMSSLHPFAACLWSGCTFVSMRHFDAKTAAQQVLTEDITILYPAFPTIANDLLAVAGFSPERLTRLRRINCVAPPEGLQRLQQCFAQAKLTSVYGLTEAGGVVAYGDPNEPLEVRISSCGRPFDGIEVRIAESAQAAGDSGQPLGEIQLRGWCVFTGYYGEPEATRAAVSEDGWLRTGDLGFLDSEGRLHYRGRLKDVIKVAGENVSAVEIETVLMRHPAVKLAQVIAAPEARHGEVPVAFVELYASRPATQELLIEYCSTQLARFKIPRRVLFVTQWPMSATKIQKHRLRERL